MAISMEQVLAFEVLRRKKHKPVERLGHVVRAENAGEFMWLAYSIIPHGHDSFIGSFATPKLAREAILENEKKFIKGRRDG